MKSGITWGSQTTREGTDALDLNTQPTYLLNTARLQCNFLFLDHSKQSSYLPYISPWIALRFAIQLQRMPSVLKTAQLIHFAKMIFMAEDISSYSVFAEGFQPQQSAKSFSTFTINTR